MPLTTATAIVPRPDPVRTPKAGSAAPVVVPQWSFVMRVTSFAQSARATPDPRPECRPAHLADLDRATKPATHHRSVAPGYRQMLCHGEKNSGGGWHFTSRTS